LLETEIPVACALIAAGFASAAVSFGDALLSMPLLALLILTGATVPLVALTALLIALVILIREWKHVKLRTTFVLS